MTAAVLSTARDDDSSGEEDSVVAALLAFSRLLDSNEDGSEWHY